MNLLQDYTRRALQTSVDTQFPEKDGVLLRSLKVNIRTISRITKLLICFWGYMMCLLVKNGSANCSYTFTDVALNILCLSYNFLLVGRFSPVLSWRHTLSD
jgi:hypothetical protein